MLVDVEAGGDESYDIDPSDEMWLENEDEAVIVPISITL